MGTKTTIKEVDKMRMHLETNAYKVAQINNYLENKESWLKKGRFVKKDLL